MAAEVGSSYSRTMHYSLAEKPFVVIKALRSEAATQQFQQLNPPRKRRAESITGRTDDSDKAFQWKNNGQHTDDRAKVLRGSFR